MSKKTAVVDIKLTGLESIEELERRLEAVNEQLRNMKDNAAQFQDLSTEANNASEQVKNINDELSNVSGGDAAASVENIGETIADTFSEGGNVINEFAEEGVDAITDVVEETGSLGDAIQVVSKIGQTFATGMGGNLKGVSRGFAVMGQSAKVAGASIKATMAATGIGLLLVVLQTLIMNWDKLSKAIKTTKEQKKLFEEEKILQQEADYVAKVTDEYVAQLEAQKKINESQGNTEANTALDIEINKKKTAELEKQNELLANQAKQAAITAKDDEEKAKKVRDRGWGGLDIETKRAKKLKEISDESQRQADILNEQITTNQNLLELYDEQNRALQNQQNQKTYLDDIDTKIAALENANALLEAEGERTKDIYANNQKINTLKQQRLEYEILFKESEENSDRIARERLDAERAAAAIAEKRRVTELKLQSSIIALEIEYNRIIRETNNNLALQQKETERILKVNDKKLEESQQEINLRQRLADYDDYRTQAQIKAFPFDKKGLEILKETLGLRSDEIKMLEEFEGINVNVAQLSQRIKLEYLNRIDAMNAMHQKQLEILQTEKETNDVAIKSLENEINIAKSFAENTKIVRDAAEYEKKIAQERLANEMAVADSQKNWEKIAGYQEDILKYDNEIAKYDADAAGYQNEIYQAQQGINALQLENLQIQDEITAENENYAASQAQITYELETQLRLYARMQEFLDKYAEEIQATQELISASMEFVAVMYDRQADEAAAKMKKLNDELKKLEKREENINELKEELKDADGERYDNLLALIAQEEEAELNKNMSIEEQRQAIEAEIAAQEAKKMEAEYQAAKWRKAQAIIDAVIAGALATIKALPNVVLAALTAALSAVNIGIIASQKLPEKPPKQALGGYIDGKSHAQGGEIVEIEGGEYIINKKSTSQYLPLLEAINNAGIKKYAEGGTTAPVMTNNTDDFFDYDRMAEAVLKGIQPTVSVVEINRMQRRVKVLESKARI